MKPARRHLVAGSCKHEKQEHAGQIEKKVTSTSTRRGHEAVLKRKSPGTRTRCQQVQPRSLTGYTIKWTIKMRRTDVVVEGGTNHDYDEFGEENILQ